MRRGELWTLKDKNYAAKARPVVIVQAALENDFDSVILCLFTTFESDSVLTRVKIEPTIENGLEKISYVMTEKIITVEKTMLGMHIGDLTDKEMRIIAGKLAKIFTILVTSIHPEEEHWYTQIKRPFEKWVVRHVS
jgi:mRNA interferase MazF